MSHHNGAAAQMEIAKRDWLKTAGFFQDTTATWHIMVGIRISEWDILQQKNVRSLKRYIVEQFEECLKARIEDARENDN